MTLNQLFKKQPTIELVFKILNLLKIYTVDEMKYKTFSKNDITSSVLEEMENLKPVFEEYYIKCKFDVYFTFLDDKKIVTILRQCLKAINYKLVSKKEYLSGKRLIVYSVLDNTDTETKNNNNPESLQTPKSTTIVFD